MSAAASRAYCTKQVQHLDPDRYITTLFLPSAKREAVQALFAFNLEIAKTRESVSEPMLGQIRLQWWRESIAQIYDGSARDHPVVQALTPTIRSHNLSPKRFEELIDSREFDLTDGPPKTLAELETYAANSSGALLELAMEVLGQQGQASPMTAARHIGLAWSLIGLVRAFPFHARSKRLFLPADLLDAAKVDRRTLFSQATAPGLDSVIRKLIETAENHLTGARALRADIPREVRCGLLQATLTSTYIARIRRAAFEPRDLPQSSPNRASRLTLATLLRRY